MKNSKGMKKVTGFAATAACIMGALGMAAPAPIFAEEVTAEEETVTEGRTVPYYDTTNGSWDGKKLTLTDGSVASEAFFCDGTYTYYLQNNGTPMTDRLTYHPDGEHIIYFDGEGHEVFSNFTNVKKSIAGDGVDDLCFFDVYGSMYVDFVTYDQAGEKLYYANPYGVMERNGWFTFSDKQGGGLGYANADGTLVVNQSMYDPSGKLVYIQGNGKVEGTGEDLATKIYTGRNGVNPNVTVVGGNTGTAQGSHGKLSFNGDTISYGGYTYPVANINATSANFTGKDSGGFEYGNEWYNGVNFAGVFNAGRDYLYYKEYGFTKDNVINHFVQNSIYESDANVANFSAFEYLCNYYDELYPMYGSDLTYYYLDFLTYGYSEGRVVRGFKDKEAEEKFYTVFMNK